MFVGDTVTYRVAGTATSTVAEDLTLRVHVAHDDADTVPANNDASAVVRVVPTGGGGGGGGNGGDGSGGTLPRTGTDATLPLLAAALMVLFGAALAAPRRRHRPRHALG
jgi:LPXTG-motif cell wall-anchored protein